MHLHAADVHLVSLYW